MRCIALGVRDGAVRAEVIVDDDDYEFASQWRWWFDGRYAARRINGKKKYLHRLLMGEPDCGVDHINRNKLDCRRVNLRLATTAQNNQNVERNGPSGYRGVTFYRRTGKWMAQCKVNGKLVFGGYFDDLEAAAEQARKLREEHMTHATS